MSKLEDKVNEILGVDTPVVHNKEFSPPVERKEGELQLVSLMMVRDLIHQVEVIHNE